MASNFAHATGSLMPIDNFAPERQDELAAALRLRPAEAANLMLLIESGKRSIGWLSLWDNFDEDGDVVSVTSAGFTQVVPLIHEPKRIMVVYVPGEPIYVTGERDGVGGITVAVELTTGPLPLPIMAVGQTVALPVQ